MRFIRIVLLVFAVLLSVTGCQKSADKSAPALEQVGEAITISAITPLAALLEKPEDFLNQIVMVEGQVTGRCMGSGCWVTLDSGDPENPLYAKSMDESFIFPESVIDQKVRIQGEVLVFLPAETSHEGHDHSGETHDDHSGHDHAGGDAHVCPEPIYYINPAGLEILK